MKTTLLMEITQSGPSSDSGEETLEEGVPGGAAGRSSAWAESGRTRKAFPRSEPAGSKAHVPDRAAAQALTLPGGTQHRRSLGTHCAWQGTGPPLAGLTVAHLVS